MTENANELKGGRFSNIAGQKKAAIITACVNDQNGYNYTLQSDFSVHRMRVVFSTFLKHRTVNLKCTSNKILSYEVYKFVCQII